MASISGNVSGREVDKIKVLEELGFKFYKAKKINTLMVQDASVNIECKWREEINVGDHGIFIGEVVEVSTTKNELLVYYNGKYGRVVYNIPKPSEEERERFNTVIKRYIKSS